MLPHLLDNRLTDGGEVVGITLLSLFTARKIPGTYLLTCSVLVRRDKSLNIISAISL
jgi:hypothetical protein